MNRITAQTIKPEVVIKTSRSSGPGGQHANKVETKVTLRWHIGESRFVTDIQKQMIRAANASHLTNMDELVISSESKRSQIKNKEIAFKKLDRMLAKAFVKKKVRKPTQPTKAARKKRLESKRKQAKKKQLRQRGDWNTREL